MKRLRLFLVTALVLLGLGFNAKAQEWVIHVEWDNPGAVTLKKGYTVLSIPDGATTYDYVGDSEWASNLVVGATGGYVIESVTVKETGAAVPPGYTGYSLSMSTYHGQTIVVKTTKPTIDAKFTVKVVHSPEIVKSVTLNETGTDISGFKIGDNEIEYASTVDKTVTIVADYGTDPVTGVGNNRKFYSIKKNGTDISTYYNIYSNVYKNIAIADGDVFEIVPFENAPVAEKKESTLSFSVPEGLECIKSVFNRSTSKFIQSPFTGEAITVESGTNLQFNLNADVNYTLIKIGETEYDCEDVADFGYVRYTTTDDNVTMTIKAAEKDYGTRKLTLYVENPQGIALWAKKGVDGYRLDLSTGGEDVTETITLGSKATFGKGSYTMQNPKKYVFEISQKYPTCMWTEVEGSNYWIYAASETKADEAEIPFYGATLYLVAREIKNDTRAVVYLAGPENGIKIASNAKWGSNIKHDLVPGYQYVDFDKVYEVDFSVKAGTNAIAGVYLNGAVQSLDENEQYSALAMSENSVLKIYADGRSSVKSSTITYSSLNDGKATFTYDLVKTLEAPNTLKATDATDVVIEPLDGSLLFLNDCLAELDAEGKYAFTTKGGTNYDFKVVKLATAEIGSKPADGTTVKQLSKVTLQLPLNGSLMFSPVEDKFSQIAITDEAGNTVAGVMPGEAWMNDDETAMLFELGLTEPITTSGKYTVNVPAGALIEVEFDETADAFVQRPASRVNAAYTATVTVDPDFVAAIEKVKVSPDHGHALNKIAAVYVDFTQFTAYTNVQLPAYGMQAYFTYDDETEYEANITRNWNNPDCCGFVVTPVNDEGDDVVLTKEGNVTLWIKAGTFSYDGDKSNEIEVTYSIAPTHPAYPITPSHGSTAARLHRATISFPGVVEASYNNEKTIQLTGTYNRTDAAPLADGPDFTTTATVTPGKAANEFYLSFAKEPSINGQYTISVPAGAFTLDDEASEETAATIAYEQPYTLFPTPGTETESLDEILISFPKATTVSRNAAMDDDEVSFRSLDNSWAPSRWTVTEVADAEVPTWAIQFTPAPAKITTYALLIPEGFFTIDGIESQDINAQYTLFNKSVDLSYDFNPTGSVINQAYAMVGVAFEEIHNVTIADASKVTLKNNETVLEATQYQLMAEGNFFVVMFENGIPEEGTVTLDMAEGALSVSSTASPAINHTWNVVAPKAYKLTVTPSSNLTSASQLAKVTIVIDEAKEATVAMPHGVSLVSSDYSTYPYQTGTITPVEGAQYPTFEVTFPTPDKVTSYSLTIAYGTFLIDGAFENDRLQVNYVISSGIDEIAGDENGDVEIYNLQGVKVNTKWNELPAGIYIVGGKKTIKE